MTYGTDLVRVSVKYGPRAASTWLGELAVTTFHLHLVHQQANTFVWADEVQPLADNIAQKYADHATAWGPFLGQNYAIREIKAAHIDATGHTLDEGVHSPVGDFLQGSATGTLMPPEVACCVSFWAYQPGTFTTHKGRKRARFYLPYLPSSMSDSDGKISNTASTDLLAAFKALFNDIQGMHTNATPTPPNSADFWAVVAASKVDASINQVSFISVDDHFDSQRRRQHQVAPVLHLDTISHA